MTPVTSRLLQHWRHHAFSGVRPFFCQIEAVETAIWLTEVAPHSKNGKRLLDHLASTNRDANPELMRLALKLATGAGKTTVMAMLIAWQTINAERHRGSTLFTRGFLVCAPGLTIKDRLRVLQPNDPDSYYKDRELVPSDMLDEVNRARIVITNYHAFKLRERIELSRGGRQLLQGRNGDEIQTLETEGQMIQRVMPGLMGMKNILERPYSGRNTGACHQAIRMPVTPPRSSLEVASHQTPAPSRSGQFPTGPSGSRASDHPGTSSGFLPPTAPL